MTTDDVSTRAAAAITRYGARLHQAAGSEQHVVSALGAWLVLALAGLADDGTDTAARREVETALGMPLADAGRVAAELLDEPHPAVAAAVGLWWREDVATDRLRDYEARLPDVATRGALPGQRQLDTWAREHTLGLIDRFPVDVTPDVLLVLASALATRVRWLRAFEVVPGSELAAPGRGDDFGARVARALRSVEGHDVRLVRTSAAGLVGAHVAASADGLAVVSVLGPTNVDRSSVLAAADEVAARLDGARIDDPVSLFDVPAGASELGEIAEDTVAAKGRFGRVEEGVAVLPAWQASTQLDLLRGPPREAFTAAGRLLHALLPGGPLNLQAQQVAVARYTREGFEAAAVTAVAVRLAFTMVPAEIPRRRLTLRFNRPYAAVAVAVRPPVDTAPDDRARPSSAADRIAPSWFGLPVFSAWVARPAQTPPAEE